MKVFCFQTYFLIKTLFSSSWSKAPAFDVSCNEDWMNGDVKTTPFLKHYKISDKFKEDRSILVKVEVNMTKNEELCSLVTIQKMSKADCEIEKRQKPTSVFEDISMGRNGKKRRTIYERMLTKSGMVIDPSQYPEGFALTVLNYNSTKPCNSTNPSEPHTAFKTIEMEQNRNVLVNITSNGTTKQYLLAILISLGIYIIIFVIVLVITCSCDDKDRKPEAIPLQIPHPNSGEPEDDPTNIGGPEDAPTNKGGDPEDAPTNSGDQEDAPTNSGDPEDALTNSLVEAIPTSGNPEVAGTHDEQTTQHGESILSPKRDGSYRSSRLYLSLIFIIGFFYALPAWSAVRYKMGEIDNTGNMDICFYNAYCRKPLGVFKDFSHVFSNLGYIILGITFFFVVQIKKAKRRKINFLGQCRWTFLSHGSPPTIPNSENGVLVQYGIYQALALALCMEGIMSSCYHICPTNTNFQFDTTFMYIMGFLIFIKIYQNRHPNQTPSSITTFFIISSAMTFVVIHRYLPSVHFVDTDLVFWAFFYVYYLALIFYITWISFKRENFDAFFNDFVKVILPCGKDKCCECWNPEHKIQNIFTCILFWLNIALFLSDIIRRLLNVGPDIADVLLHIFIGNGIMYMGFYLITKCCLAQKERSKNAAENMVGRKTSEFPGKINVVFLILGIVFIAVAYVYFIKASTDKAKSPAQSSMENSDCLDPFNFYDAHDLWHMTGAVGLFCLFLFIFTLDDRTSYARRDNMNVF